MTPATNNRNAQRFWEAAYLAALDAKHYPLAMMNPTEASRVRAFHGDLAANWALLTWLDRFGTPEERVQFEEWQQAQGAGNEAEAV